MHLSSNNQPLFTYAQVQWAIVSLAGTCLSLFRSGSLLCISGCAIVQQTQLNQQLYVALSQKYGRRGGLLPSLHSMALYYTRTSQALSCTVTLNCTAPPNTFVYSIPFPCAARSILTTISPLGTRVCLIRRRRHIHGQCYAGHAPLKYANHRLRHTQHTGVAAAAGQSSPAHICVWLLWVVNYESIVPSERLN